LQGRRIRFNWKFLNRQPRRGSGETLTVLAQRAQWAQRALDR
jgi:hypothetical protein